MNELVVGYFWGVADFLAVEIETEDHQELAGHLDEKYCEKLSQVRHCKERTIRRFLRQNFRSARIPESQEKHKITTSIPIQIMKISREAIEKLDNHNSIVLDKAIDCHDVEERVVCG